MKKRVNKSDRLYKYYCSPKMLGTVEGWDMCKKLTRDRKNRNMWKEVKLI